MYEMAVFGIDSLDFKVRLKFLNLNSEKCTKTKENDRQL